MNAVSVFRLFTRLFLGKRRTGFTAVVDALPRERWILAIGIMFVVLGGLFPNVIVARRSAEADLVERAVRAHPPVNQVCRSVTSDCGGIPATVVKPGA